MENWWNFGIEWNFCGKLDCCGGHVVFVANENMWWARSLVIGFVVQNSAKILQLPLVSENIKIKYRNLPSKSPL